MRQALHLMTLAALAVWIAAPAVAAPLGELRWQKRVVVLFGSGPESQAQLDRLLERRTDLAERQLLVIQADRTVRIVYGQTDATLPGADALRTNLGRAASDRYEAVLVGLDGGVKWRSTHVVDPDELFAVIDAMPMRRADR